MLNTAAAAAREPDLCFEHADDVLPEVLKTIIAFANTDGGRLFIRMRKKGACGALDDMDEAIQALRRLIQEEVEPDLTPFVKLEILDGAPGRTGPAILVETAAAPERPYALKRSGTAPGGVWIRRYGRTAEAKPSIIAAMKREALPRWDSQASLNPSPGFSGLKRICLEKGLLGAETLRDSRSFLTQDGAWSRAAEVFSDENPFLLRCVRFPKDGSALLEDERFGGGLLAQLFSALAWLEARGGGRFGLNLIREALVNALLHRDYLLDDAEILVKLFADRLEIVSPGGLPKGMTSEDAAGGLARVRNPGILEALRSVGLARGIGESLGRVRDALEKRGGHLRIRALPGAVVVSLELGRAAAAPREGEAAAAPSDGENAGREREQKLSKVESLAVEFLKLRPGAARREVQEAVGLSQAGTVNLLRRLIERGLAKADGNGPSTRYRLCAMKNSS